MREIKFRAFHKGFKKIYGVFQIEFPILADRGSIELFDDVSHTFFFTKREEVELLQFTGLKDKNGEEIYEGYIVKDDHNEVFTVEYGCQEVDAFEGIGFNLWTFIGDYGVLDCKRLQSELEVLGNRYENPELLPKIG